ncbi:MAG: polyamine ABC transporter substrate-binding protein [Phyllobacteriaceae bacterium]|nr:polyamine ABC transporter substrate-binding protein [Phyllobacteriaceae bacterium]
MKAITRRGAVTMLGGALAAPFVNRGHAGEGVVNIYNWADYFAETTLDDFTAKTGIKAVYDVYSSVEEMQAKMLAGSTGYDVIVLAGIDVGRFAKSGVVAKLDRAKLPGWGNLDPEIMRILSGWDAGNEHGIPYMWGSTGMTYNTGLVEQVLPGADLGSLDLVFKPENAAKLAEIGLSMLDSPFDVFALALKYLGLDGDTTNLGDYDKVVELFKPIRQHIRTFDNENNVSALANGEIGVANSWSGQAVTAQKNADEAGLKAKFSYQVPVTGGPIWVDTFCVPADAPNKDNAHAFLDFMLDPVNVAKCTDYTYYANGNAAAKAHVAPDVLANPAIYPDAATMARLWAPKPFSEEQDRAITRAWQTIKTG